MPKELLCEHKRFHPNCKQCLKARLAFERGMRLAGYNAFYRGVHKEDFPRVGKPYSSAMYRAKSCWQDGWLHGLLESTGRLPMHRSVALGFAL
jgi:hypothetical protein